MDTQIDHLIPKNFQIKITQFENLKELSTKTHRAMAEFVREGIDLIYDKYILDLDKKAE